MAHNLHKFKSPISNISTMVSADGIENDFKPYINNTYSFKSILETLGEKSAYRWNDLYIWLDANIWSDVELS